MTPESSLTVIRARDCVFFRRSVVDEREQMVTTQRHKSIAVIGPKYGICFSGPCLSVGQNRVADPDQQITGNKLIDEHGDYY